ncbi:MAG: hypothetical protein AAFU56_07220, partial [Pseudomonadota bacterium]
MTIPAEQLEFLRRLQRDPVLWVTAAFDGEIVLQEWQKAALRKLQVHPKLAIASCNGAGKSFLLCLTVLWYLTTRNPCKVVVTAGSANQINDVLWSELAAMVQMMRPPFNELEVTTDKVRTPRPNCFAVARTARRETPDALQGHHSDNMLFVLDEASGIDDKIIEVGRGSLSTVGARIIATGNPVRRQGWFYDAHHNPKVMANWARMNIAANEKLAKEHGVEFFAQHVDEQLVTELRDTYGEESGPFRARALGLFPNEDSDVLIPAQWVQAAFERNVQPYGDECWGLDVARFGGDRTALCKRRGRALVEPVLTRRNLSVMETSGWVKSEYEAADRKPDYILVDVIGVGAGVVDRLREQNLPAVAINVAESPSTKDRYSRLRDELWWRAREWFLGKEVFMPEDIELKAELTAPTYTYQSNGKIKIESKDETKRRLGFSPDKADAFVLTFAGNAAALADGAKRKWKPGVPLKRGSKML